MHFVDQLNLQDKKVLIRADLNVPLKNGSITDDSRIRASLPTMTHCLDKGAAVIVCSHLDKPGGKVVPELSMAPIADRLAELLDRDVMRADDVAGTDSRDKADALRPGQVLILENLRFDPDETRNGEDLSRRLAGLADIYINDAFGVCHRAHASVVGVTGHMEMYAAGLLLKKELEYLSKAVKEPDRPFVAISGGAKVSTKLSVLKSLLDRVDRMIIGGAMATTFLKAQGYSVGSSLTEDHLLDEAREIMKTAREKKIGFYLPVDFIVGDGPDGTIGSGVRPFQGIPEGEMALDTGPASHALFAEVLRDAGTVIWNGPMGVFENPAFSQGSVGLCNFVASLKATTIIGGGDTGALVHLCRLENQFSFVSTGGGSFLEFLEGKTLPAIAALG